MKTLCKCGNYKPYSSILKGINAPMMDLDACVNCIKAKPLDESKFATAMNKVNMLNKEN